MLKVLFDSGKNNITEEYLSIYNELCSPSWKTVASSLYEHFAPTKCQEAIKMASRWFFKDKVGSKGVVYTGSSIVEQNQFELRSRHINIQQNFKACREKSVSTALIAYCLLESFVQFLDGKNVVIGYPINIRDQFALSLEDHENTFGVYVKGAEISLPASAIKKSTTDWKEEQVIHHMITENSKSNKGLELTGMLKYINVKDWVL